MSKNTIGYVGPRGTFSEEAALLYNRERGFKLRACATIASVFEHVLNGELAEGIIPLDNPAGLLSPPGTGPVPGLPGSRNARRGTLSGRKHRRSRGAG